MTADEINIGIAAILESFEMTSVLFLSFIFVQLFIQAESIESSHSFTSRPSHTGHTALKRYPAILLPNGPSV
jgi:retron-type reverse transcriptase